MSMSLRDQLLQAGLISKKQADEAERQNQQRERRPAAKPHPTPANRRPGAPRPAAAQRPAAAPRPTSAPRPTVPRPAPPSAEVAAKAARRARAAQIKQLIAQNCLPPIDSGDLYHFVVDSKIRRIAVNPATRARLVAGEISIARHDGAFHLIPTALAAKFQEVGIPLITAPVGGAARSDAGDTEGAYAEFPVPDDLTW